MHACASGHLLLGIWLTVPICMQVLPVAPKALFPAHAAALLLCGALQVRP